jgi:hypothetical protein
VTDGGRLLRDVLHEVARLLSASAWLAEDARAAGAEFTGGDADREARWL